MKYPILYSFKRCPYAMRARMSLKLADIKCELREVRLSNKPNHMLEVSPKGTVPVLILEDKVIDESIEIINWVLEQNNIFEGNLSEDQEAYSENMIKLFDYKFKFHLDRYKYASRYEDSDEVEHRIECVKILYELEKNLSNQAWFFGEKINKLDIAILPFLRQFRIANPKWFDEELGSKKVKKYLHRFIESNLLRDVMIKYEVWHEDSALSYFP
tara:strand:+ start:233 stop:874 length:642 start_codon:yes stop_codon:yes gene_type:complete